MTAQDITIERVNDLAITLMLSAESMIRLQSSILCGEISPEEAAAQVAETIETVNQSAR